MEEPFDSKSDHKAELTRIHNVNQFSEIERRFFRQLCHHLRRLCDLAPIHQQFVLWIVEEAGYKEDHLRRSWMKKGAR
ncbi:hypothetical protein E3N88_35419 [Mikania micrantha]|uniref:Uncharacterized protein n=1 Tax=Mikania micrantha TaxID=192012 RepID=A0A5N6M0V9_9ASTR|nr:hypothetical protein E3N88_35419 [Mikania micrantha]